MRPLSRSIRRSLLQSMFLLLKQPLRRLWARPMPRFADHKRVAPIVKLDPANCLSSFHIVTQGVQDGLVAGMIGTMQNRRCMYCGRKIHPALRPDAKYCGRSCKSSYHRDKKQQPVSSPDRFGVPLAPAMASLADTVQTAAPQNAVGYILRRQRCPLGDGTFDFPISTRKTKQADGTLRKSLYYQLLPFEPPRVPWPGPYELLFWVPDIGLVFSDDPQRQQIYLGKTATVPRAAFDEQALYLWLPAHDGTDAGSAEYLQREVLARAPAGAIGYRLSTDSSPLGPGLFRFPPSERPSRRADRGLRDVPYYSLNPFELPCVPWAGAYTLSYDLQHGMVHFNSDPALQMIRVGLIFPHADLDGPARALPAHSELQPGGRSPLLLHGSHGPRRALRQRRLGKRQDPY